MKKKVLFLVHQLNHGGIQKELLLTLDAIDYSRYDVTLYIRKPNIELIDEVNANVSQIIVNERERGYYRSPEMALLAAASPFSSRAKKTLEKRLTERKVAYEKGYFRGKSYDVAVAYAQGETAKLMADYVDANYKIMFYHDSEDPLHELHSRIFNKIDKIVGVSPAIAENLKKFYPGFADKVTYVSNYVDCTAVRSRGHSRDVVRSSGITLCSCGRFTKVKGFDLALDAAKILKEDGLKFIWYFVGDGEERAELEDKIVALGLSDNIIITGIQNNPYPYMACCDIFVLPSRAEAFPLTAIEAQLLCRPIVTTRTVGGEYAVKDGVLGLVADINAQSLSEKILYLAYDEQFRTDIEKRLAAIDHSDDFKNFSRAVNHILNH